MCSIEDCVRSGRLIPVSVGIPPTSVFAIGDARSAEVYKNPMNCYSCEDNSRCVVEGMNALGASDWVVVGGFAFGPIPDFPTVHVWVRKGSTHFDPTWSRLGGEIRGLAQYRYF